MRPGIKLSPSPFDKGLEFFGWLILAALWCFTLFAYFKLPGTIPIHYNARGQVNGIGSKSTIFLLPVIVSVVFISMTVLNKFPHIFNYPVTITHDNALLQYTNATRMLRYLKTVIVIIFSLISLFTYWTATGKTSGLGAWFAPFTLIAILFPAIYFIVRSFSFSKSQK